VITSQLKHDLWHDYLADPTVADAICDGRAPRRSQGRARGPFRPQSQGKAGARLIAAHPDAYTSTPTKERQQRRTTPQRSTSLRSDHDALVTGFYPVGTLIGSRRNTHQSIDSTKPSKNALGRVATRQILGWVLPLELRGSARLARPINDALSFRQHRRHRGAVSAPHWQRCYSASGLKSRPRPRTVTMDTPALPSLRRMCVKCTRSAVDSGTNWL
jgi:hypothetical protein